MKYPTRAASTPAKLTRPSARDIVPRARLFSVLDATVDTRCVWVGAPGGCGKTALASSWIETRRPACIWYQCDAGDADIATFFHYLGQAARSARPRRRWTLVDFTPEYALGLEVYARRFFEELYAGLGPGAVVVLDDYQEVPPGAALHAQIGVLLSSVPAGSRLVALSRQDPPPALARWVAGREFRRLTAADLALTTAEAESIASAVPDGALKRDAVEQLNALARGWAAGLLLLLRDGRPDEGCGEGTVLFDYLAAEVYARAAPELRAFLLRTSWLPTVTPTLARRLTGRVDAAEVLDRLARERFFTDRRSGASAVFEYHPLLRSFLRDRALVETHAAAPSQAIVETSRALEAEGAVEDALSLYLDARQWSDATRLILAEAPSCLARGRLATLESWIRRVDEVEREAAPWLGFWLGTCRTLADPREGRAILVEAYRRFKAAGDRSGCLLCWAGISESYFIEMSDFTSFDEWVGEIEELLPTGREFPQPAIEIRVIGGAMGLLLHRPEHRFILPWAERGLALAGSVDDTNARVQLCGFTSWVWMWRGDFVRSAQAWRLGTPSARETNASPIHRLLVGMCLCAVSWHQADHAAAHASIDDAIALADSTGVHVTDTLLHLVALYADLSAADLARAHHHLTRALETVAPFRQLERSHLQFMHAGVELAEGRLQAALARCEGELGRAESFSAPFPLVLFRIQTAQMLMLVGRHTDARATLAKARAVADAMGSEITCFHCAMYFAWSCFDTGEDAAGVEALREALAIGARHDYMNCHPWWIPAMMSRLMSRALAAGIEVDYVRRFVRFRGIEPETVDVPRWPWPVRLHALGVFRVELDDQPLQFSGKAQARPLELLKALVAAGGRDVPSDTLIDMLWPEAEGDAGRAAWDVTLHRTRKLLGRTDALMLADGKLSLNPAVVWSDVRVLESALARLGLRPTRLDADKALDEAHRLLRGYAGPFIADESSRPWVTATRERLRYDFQRAVLACGRALQQAGRWREALELWRAGIEREPTAEAFYQEAMCCLGETGLAADVVRVHDELRAALAHGLGVQPSDRSRALRDRYARRAD